LNYKFWNEYNYIDKELAVLLDKRLKNVIDRIENFFRNVIIKHFDEEYIDFYLAGSCLKRDTFRDIDIFFLTKQELEKVLDRIDEKYFLYRNNSHTFIFEDDIFQCVYRERFLNKNLKDVIDIFDFYSTKIGFKCRLYTNTKRVEVIQSDIRETFIEYMKKRYNDITRINQNPFVSLQRAIHFSKSGDTVPFHAFLNIIFEIMKIDPTADFEKCLQRIQGNEDTQKIVKEAISQFLEKKKEL
jgi:hypothetical protein